MIRDALFLFAPAGGGSATTMMFLFQMLAIIAIFYFLIVRPRSQQEKRHRERLAQIKRGDRIVTAGGVIGTVVRVKDDQLTIKSGESRLAIQRGRVAEILGDEKSDDTK